MVGCGDGRSEQRNSNNMRTQRQQQQRTQERVRVRVPACVPLCSSLAGTRQTSIPSDLLPACLLAELKAEKNELMLMMVQANSAAVVVFVLVDGWAEVQGVSTHTGRVNIHK